MSIYMQVIVFISLIYLKIKTITYNPMFTDRFHMYILLEDSLAIRLYKHPEIHSAEKP